MERSDAANDLGPKGRAVTRAISEFGRPPIDAAHVSIEPGRSGPALVFRVPARSQSEFDVEVVVGEDSYTMYCDGWHEQFGWSGDDGEDVRILLEKLVTLLDGRTRLRVRYVGAMPYRWELLHDYGGEVWQSLSVTSLLFYNYLGKRRTVEKRNRRLRTPGTQMSG